MFFNQKFNPSQPFEPKQFQNTFEELFHTSISDLVGHGYTSKSPYANIQEFSNNYQISIIAPGLQKSDFDVSLNDGKLDVSVKKELSNKPETTKTIKKEWDFQHWTRTFHIDDTLEAGHISASYDKGILIVNVPKKEKESVTVKTVDIL